MRASCSRHSSASRLMISGVTPGKSPRMIMMAADSELSAPIPARYDDEQPSPKTGFSTTRAAPKSICSRTWSTARPRTTTTSSRLDARRAWSTTQPSIVVPRKGASCFGGPNRCEAPAPSTNPEINFLIGSIHRLHRRSANLCDLCNLWTIKRFLATQAAEIERLAVDDRAVFRSLDVDCHAADRIGCDILNGQLRFATCPSHTNNLGHDTQRDLRQGLTADLDAGRTCNHRDIFVTCSSRAHVFEQCFRLLLACN